MSFRGRLTAFFVTIVVVPMIAVAVLVIQVTDDSRDGKADARLATGLETARTIYDRALENASAEVQRIADTVPGIDRALAAPNRAYLEQVARREARRGDVAALTFYDAAGERLAAAGSRRGIASSRRPVEVEGAVAGEIEVAGLDAGSHARELARLTGTEVAIAADRGELAATFRSGEAELPDGTGGETVELPSGEMRAAALSLDGAPDGARVVLVTDAEEGFVASEPLVGVVLLVFFGIALLLIALLLRMLQRQIAAMLAAAERIGAGDFSGRVPAEGNDEMAGLAQEFNKMSDRLSRQMQQLRKQREELDQSVRRIGEAFAAGLDRSALLEIVVQTALSACEAETGRIQLRDHVEPEAGAGAEPTGALAEALVAASRQALDAGDPVEVEVEGARGIAQPLSRAGDPGSVVGTMALARRGEAFTPAEREVLRYLAGQAAVSVENIGLHERVAEQAVTDELTGLANNRHFRDWMVRETERLGRFGGELSLVLLDIDDFKHVNDTYGHLQGDRILESVGRVLQLESRGVDEAARYGGEEFVLALPETPKQGAVEVAERIRERIRGTEVAGVDGNDPIAVTASLGVATMPGDGLDPQGLVAAADAALYEAKRTGKDRVVAGNAR